MPVSGDGILEATFDPAWAAVRLIVDGGMWPTSVDTITITRAVAGEADVPVRGVESRQVVGGTFVGTDHEMALDTTVTYRVDGYLEDVFVASAQVSVSTAGAAAGLWLKAAGRPDLTVRVPLRTVSETTSVTIGGVYQVAGGGGSVAQTSAQWSGIASDALAVTVAAPVVSVPGLRALLDRARVVLLQPVGSGDIDPGWYFVATVARVNPAQVEAFGQRWFTLNVQRTGVPAGDGAGLAGTSWAALADEHATWADVLAAYPSWFDVLKGS